MSTHSVLGDTREDAVLLLYFIYDVVEERRLATLMRTRITSLQLILRASSIPIMIQSV